MVLKNKLIGSVVKMCFLHVMEARRGELRKTTEKEIILVKTV